MANSTELLRKSPIGKHYERWKIDGLGDPARGAVFLERLQDYADNFRGMRPTMIVIRVVSMVASLEDKPHTWKDDTATRVYIAALAAEQQRWHRDWIYLDDLFNLLRESPAARYIERWHQRDPGLSQKALDHADIVARRFTRCGFKHPMATARIIEICTELHDTLRRDYYDETRFYRDDVPFGDEDLIRLCVRMRSWMTSVTEARRDPL